MFKTSILAMSLMGTAAFSVDCTTETLGRDSGVLKECASINQISITNDVEIYSSRQNLWVCGVGIKNVDSKVGSDNRVYFTRKIFKKGRDVLLDTRNEVLEASVNNFADYRSSKAASSSKGDTFDLSKYFSVSKEVRISDIRVELASLNYGAEIFVDICGETPFSYMDATRMNDTDGNGEDNRRNLYTTMKMINKFQQTVKPHTDASTGTNYPTVSGMEWNIDGFASGFDFPEGDTTAGTTHGTQQTWEALEDLADCSVRSYEACEGSLDNIFAPITSNTQESIVVSGFDHTAFLQDHPNDFNKYVVRYTLRETNSGVKRLKGLTEKAIWRQTLQTKMDINDNDTGRN